MVSGMPRRRLALVNGNGQLCGDTNASARLGHRLSLTGSKERHRLCGGDPCSPCLRYQTGQLACLPVAPESALEVGTARRQGIDDIGEALSRFVASVLHIRMAFH